MSWLPSPRQDVPTDAIEMRGSYPRPLKDPFLEHTVCLSRCRS